MAYFHKGGFHKGFIGVFLFSDFRAHFQRRGSGLFVFRGFTKDYTWLFRGVLGCGVLQS